MLYCDGSVYKECLPSATIFTDIPSHLILHSHQKKFQFYYLGIFSDHLYIEFIYTYTYIDIMAKKGSSKTKEVTKKAPAPKKAAEKSVEEIEADLQLPSSSEEEDSEEVEAEEEPLSEESGDEDIQGLSSDDDDDEVDEQIEEQAEKPSKQTSGHSVIKTISSEQTSKSKSSKSKAKTGVIYIGRLPQGFQEKELNEYFKQFGNITNIKLSRNKKTGNSKHYGFIQFDDYETAKVASEAMNNYLLFGHLLKCEVVENPAENLFEGSNKKFKVIPWKTISKHKHDKPKSKKQWEVLIKKHEQQKQKKQQELKSKGIDFSL